MTNTAELARYAEGDFSVGRVLNRTFMLLTRNFLPFFTVTAVASLPTVLLAQGRTFDATLSGEDMAFNLGLMMLGVFLGIVLYTLSQAIVLYAAFQDMRGRPVNLTESLQVGLRRFFPIVGLAISLSVFAGFAAMRRGDAWLFSQTIFVPVTIDSPLRCHFSASSRTEPVAVSAPLVFPRHY